MQTSKGIYTYNYIEKQKVGNKYVLVGVGNGNTLVNLCEPTDCEEMLDQYINYIKDRLNEAEKYNRGTNLVIDLSKINSINDCFCLIAYTKNGRPCIAIERNYLGVEGEISVLNYLIRSVESLGCVVTNSCSIIVTDDRLIMREMARTSIYTVDYILMRSGFDKKVLNYISNELGRQVPFRFEYRQKGSKVIQSK